MQKINAQKITYTSIKDAGKEIRRVQPGGGIFVVTDEIVAGLYLDTLKKGLESQGFSVVAKVIPPGEKSKRGETYLEILEVMAGSSITRSDGILAIGGGVVGDISGFAAATYMRGIKFYQVPTTLLAMVDSAIGGKTAIDLMAGKNLAGAFYLPSIILSDISLLESLPYGEIKNGLGEVAKYAILKGGRIWTSLVSMASDFSKEDEKLGSTLRSDEFLNIVKACAEIKIEITFGDFTDQGERRILNLGHTIGHGLEKLSGYEIPHGIAVAKGISAISRIGLKQGWIRKEVLDKIEDLLVSLGFDTSIPYDGKELFRTIAMDKKRSGDTISLIIPEDIGKPSIKDIDMTLLERIL